MGGNSNNYNNPGVHTSTNANQSNTARSKGSMAPPALSASASASSIGASRSPHYPPSSRSANAGQSLYASILQLPPAKQARTIHNPRDPPIPAPTRPPAMPRSRRGSTTKGSDQHTSGRPRALSLAEGTRSYTKSRREDVVPTNRHKDKGRGHKGKQKERIGGSMSNISQDTDMDLKAAATLTSLLMHSRPSVTASTTSPRSSASAGSDSGSTQSFSHFAQSSARMTAGSSSATTTAPSSQTLPALEGSISARVNRSTTPPNGLTSGHSQGSVFGISNGTPRSKPTDNEAADLMLFLATSPSPVRPSTNREKDAKDSAAYRALDGSAGLRTKGRVLFGEGSGDGKGGRSGPSRALGSDGSFTSSNGDVNMSDIGSEGATLPQRRLDAPPSSLSISITSEGEGGIGLEAAMEPTVIPPTPTEPILRQPTSLNSTVENYHIASETTPRLQAPPTPGNFPFNLNEFINVSPSPAAALKGDIGPMADIGRKLFEGEQGGAEPNRGSALGAGIDLVK